MAPSESLEMAVPTQAELHRPILEIAAESRQSLTQKEVVARLTTLFSLTEDDLQEMVPSGGQTRVANKTAWATKLKPRWDVHLSGDDDQLGCAGGSLSSVLGE